MLEIKIFNCLILIVVLVTVGCAPKIKPIQRIQFPVSEYEMLHPKGTGVVTGQAFMKTIGGDVKTAAGSEVMLNPVTSYSDQWFEVYYSAGKLIAAPDPKVWTYVIKTIADADGKFTLNNVPPGEYYLVTNVMWKTATGYKGALQQQGGLIAKKIKVQNGKELKIILTH